MNPTSRAQKIADVMNRAGVDAETARIELEAEDWHTNDAVHNLTHFVTPVSFVKTATEPGDILVITTTVHTRRAYITEGVFKTARDARRYCAEETQWESCQRVQCPALGIDERGSFA